MSCNLASSSPLPPQSVVATTSSCGRWRESMVQHVLAVVRNRFLYMYSVAERALLNERWVTAFLGASPSCFPRGFIASSPKQ